MNRPTTFADAVSTPSKTASDHETVPTLPNPNGKAPQNGSVMCPKTSEEALRSKPRGPATGAANDVTPKGDAQHPTQGGAAFAGAVATRRAQSAADNVIEAEFEGEGIPPSKRDDVEASLQLSDAEAVEIFKRARSLLVNDAEIRAKRKDTTPSPSTMDTYRQKCKLVDAKMASLQDPGDTPLKVVMSKYAPTKSFGVMHAAIKSRAIARVRSQIQVLVAIQRARLRDAAWHRGLHELDRMVSELQQVLDLDRAVCLGPSQRKAVRSKSKKYTLHRLKRGWRDAFLTANEHSKTYKRAGVLMRFCGFRAVELQNGVEAELIGDQVHVQIAGGKVRETAGQPWRRFSLFADRFPPWFVAELKSGKKTFTADPDNMRTHLVRISARLYPRKHKDGKEDIILSAYVFRHALATDLRGQGWTADEIAAVLGESSAETAAWYGLRPQRGSRDSEPSAIVKGSTETCRPVREPDRTWLNKGVLADRDKPKKAKSSRPKM